MLALIGIGSSTLAVAPPAAAATGGPIVNARSQHCLDARSTVARLYDCTGEARQSWTVSTAGEIRLVDGSRCLTAGSSISGSAARTAACDGSAAQRFRIAADGSIAASSGLCLDGGAVYNGVTVMVRTCTGGTPQRWSVPATAFDTTPPTAPASLRVDALTRDSVTLIWSAATDDTGVTGYDIYHDGLRAGDHHDRHRSRGRRRHLGLLRQRPRRGRKRLTGQPHGARPTPVLPAGQRAATTPTGLTGTATGTTVVLSWTAATDNVAVTAYLVLRDGTINRDADALTISDTLTVQPQ